MTKFEVGKKYQFRGMGLEECVAVSGDLAWLQPKNGRGSIVDRVHDGWREVKEPRKFSGWINILSVNGESGSLSCGAVHATRDKALANVTQNSTYLDTIEITYTEKV